MNVRRVAILILALFAVPSAAQQPAAIRLSELHNASDEVLVRLFFGRAAAFPYVGYRDPDGFRGGLVRRYASLWFYSQAHATERAGVCRADRLIITLERVLLSGRDDPLMQPRAFSLQPIFYIENGEEAHRLTNPTRRNSAELQTACNALDPRRDGIPADYAFQLMKALELVQALGDGARAGRAIAPLDCGAMNWNADPPADEAACLRDLVHLRERSPAWVQDCAEAVVLEANCIRVQTSDWFIYFVYGADQRVTRVIIRGMEDWSQVG